MTSAIPKPSRVLVAVRFDLSKPDTLSEGCLAALTQARELARGAGAALHMLHVIEPPVGFPTEWLPSMLEDIQKASESALHQEVDTLAASGVTATFKIRTGEPWYEILAEAEQIAPDVIVIASRGDARLEHFIFGSTAVRLMKNSKRPVWVVHPEQREPIREVLAPLDFGDTAAKAVATGNLMNSLFGAHCYALHCVSFPNDIALQRYADGAERVREYHQQVHATATARIEGLIGESRDHWSIRLGHAALNDEIEALIQSDKIDLIVLGSISRTGIRGLLTGNTAERVFTKVDCSLWILKPDSWESPVKFE